MPLSIRCPMCRATFSAADSQRGKKVLCTHCRKPVQLPGSAAAQRPKTEPMLISCPACRCPCKVAEANYGKHVTCPRCNTTMSAPRQPSGITANPAPRDPGIQVISTSKFRLPDLSKPTNFIKGLMGKKIKGIPLPIIAGAGAAALLLLVVGSVIAIGALSSARPGEQQVADESSAEKKPKRKKKDRVRDKKKDANNKPNEKKKPRVVPDRIDKATLRQVKDATVFIKVISARGDRGEGSGFFGIENGLVLTNAHVVFMLKQPKKPRSVTIIYKSGEKGSRTFSGAVLGVDPSSDLAVLRVTGNDLPPPLKIAPANELTETQTVYVCGFPLGSKRGKAISVAKTTISSLHKDETSTYLSKVEVNGGMAPGNSGGPVVNGLGEVVGVAVSGFLGTNVNFAVPGDKIKTILNGRIHEISFQPLTRKGQPLKVSLQLELINPLMRMKKVGVVYWTGNFGQPRVPSREVPKEEPGDSPHQSVEFTHDGRTAKGTITFPALAAGKRYWIRPYFVNGADEKMWVGATVYDPSWSGAMFGKLWLTRSGFLQGGTIRRYPIVLQAGRKYQVDVKSKQFDTMVAILGPRNDLVAKDDDSGEGLNSRAQFVARQSGRHYILITSFDRGRGGSFEVQVRR